VALNPWERLRPHLKLGGPGLLSLSGGSDSSVLLGALIKAGQEIVAVTFASPLHPEEELDRAKRLTASLGVEHLILEEDPFSEADFTANPPERCYLCKRRRLTVLTKAARDRGIKIVLDGTNASDGRTYRPGLKAAQEFGVISPFLEAGLDKEDVWALGDFLGLGDWLHPASACLATRVAYGQQLTLELLERIARAEEIVAKLINAAAGSFRARSHGPLLRLEVQPDKWPQIFDSRMRIELLDRLKGLGFNYVTLDLEGFSSGSMDRAILEVRKNED